MSEPFKSGQIVRNVVPVYGEVMAYDPQKTNQEPTMNPGRSGGPGARHGETVEIPPGHTGEVLSSSDWETVVIYPIHSTGELEPHMVRVESFTDDFKRTVRHNPFKLDRSDYDDPGRPIQASGRLKWTRVEYDPRTHYLIDSDTGFPIKPVDVKRELPYVRQEDELYSESVVDLVDPDLMPLFNREFERWEQFGDPTRPPVAGSSRVSFFYNGFIRKVPISSVGQDTNRAEYEGFSNGTVPIPVARMEMDDDLVLVQEELQSISDDLTNYLAFEEDFPEDPDPLDYDISPEDEARLKKIVDENPWVRRMIDDPQVGYDAGGELRAFDGFEDGHLRDLTPAHEWKRPGG